MGDAGTREAGVVVVGGVDVGAAGALVGVAAAGVGAAVAVEAGAAVGTGVGAGVGEAAGTAVRVGVGRAGTLDGVLVAPPGVRVGTGAAPVGVSVGRAGAPVAVGVDVARSVPTGVGTPRTIVGVSVGGPPGDGVPVPPGVTVAAGPGVPVPGVPVVATMGGSVGVAIRRGGMNCVGVASNVGVMVGVVRGRGVHDGVAEDRVVGVKATCATPAVGWGVRSASGVASAASVAITSTVCLTLITRGASVGWAASRAATTELAMPRTYSIAVPRSKTTSMRRIVGGWPPRTTSAVRMN